MAATTLVQHHPSHGGLTEHAAAAHQGEIAFAFALFWIGLVAFTLVQKHKHRLNWFEAFLAMVGVRRFPLSRSEKVWLVIILVVPMIVLLAIMKSYG